MLSCTAKALVCLYWTKPKAAPMKQITIPIYISAGPLMPPRPLNLTCERGGMLISASLPNADEALTSAIVSRAQNQGFSFLI
jgi:hypothetical protein